MQGRTYKLHEARPELRFELGNLELWGGEAYPTRCHKNDYILKNIFIKYNAGLTLQSGMHLLLNMQYNTQ